MYSSTIIIIYSSANPLTPSSVALLIWNLSTYVVFVSRNGITCSSFSVTSFNFVSHFPLHIRSTFSNIFLHPSDVCIMCIIEDATLCLSFSSYSLNTLSFSPPPFSYNWPIVLLATWLSFRLAWTIYFFSLNVHLKCQQSVVSQAYNVCHLFLWSEKWVRLFGIMHCCGFVAIFNIPPRLGSSCHLLTVFLSKKVIILFSSSFSVDSSMLSYSTAILRLSPLALSGSFSINRLVFTYNFHFLCVSFFFA